DGAAEIARSYVDVGYGGGETTVRVPAATEILDRGGARNSRTDHRQQSRTAEYTRFQNSHCLIFPICNLFTRVNQRMLRVDDRRAGRIARLFCKPANRRHRRRPGRLRPPLRGRRTVHDTFIATIARFASLNW